MGLREVQNVSSINEGLANADASVPVHMKAAKSLVSPRESRC